MAREIVWRTYEGGLWVNSPSNRAPQTSLKRDKGRSAISTSSIFTRDGSEQLEALSAHSLFRFDDDRFAGVGTALHRNGVSIKTGLDGKRLTFARMEPTSDTNADHLFVAGGGDPVKVDGAGAVTNWGIVAPVDGFTAVTDAIAPKQIHTFEDRLEWATDFGIVLNDTTNFQEGTQSVVFNIPKKTAQAYFIDNFASLDLTVFGTGETSSKHDFIAFDVQVDSPQRIDSITLTLDVSSGGFEAGTGLTNKGFSKNIGRRAFTAIGTSLRRRGIVVTLSEDEIQDDNIVENDPDTSNRKRRILAERTQELMDDIASADLPEDASIWSRIRIPKSSFRRFGGAKLADFNDIKGVRIIIRANSKGKKEVVNVWMDNMQLEGGAGLQGTYKYHITQFNSTTGHRGNPNPTPVEVEDVIREPIDLANLPATSTDSQVDKIEIWRTFGDGVRYFKVGDVDIGTTTFTDNVSDYIGMHPGTVNNVLSGTELFFDSTPPPATVTYVVGPHEARLWYLDSDNPDRVSYTGKARPEAANSGFVNPAERDDPTQALIAWNRRLFVLTEGQMFEILNSDEPFIPLVLPKVPGTTAPFTVVPTPAGIIYQASDGVRVFDGMRSLLAGESSMIQLFRGQARQGLSPFVGVTATYARNEYLISDETTTLALNVFQNTWRNVGQGTTALYFEPDTRELVASFGSNIFLFEQEGTTTDGGTAISFEWETQDAMVDVKSTALLQAIDIDIDTQNQDVSIDVIVDETVTSLGTITTSGRSTVHLPNNRPGRIFSVRLSGDANRRVELFEIAMDLRVGVPV